LPNWEVELNFRLKWCLHPTDNIASGTR